VLVGKIQNKADNAVYVGGVEPAELGACSCKDKCECGVRTTCSEVLGSEERRKAEKG